MKLEKTMHDTDKLTSDTEAWDIGVLGQDEQFAVRTNQETENAVSDALGLQMISVRLQKSLIEDLKFIAKINEVGYQPLIRDVLCRFAKNEKKNIMMEILERKQLENKLKEADESKSKAGSVKHRNVA